jgi:hypothetical protein
MGRQSLEDRSCQWFAGHALDAGRCDRVREHALNRALAHGGAVRSCLRLCFAAATRAGQARRRVASLPGEEPDPHDHEAATLEALWRHDPILRGGVSFDRYCTITGLLHHHAANERLHVRRWFEPEFVEQERPKHSIAADCLSIVPLG